MSPLKKSTGNVSLLLLVALALASQQQVAFGWWLFAEPPAPTKALASFDLDGVTGTIEFSQPSSSAPTQVKYDLKGLKGNNNLYHVHVRPVPAFVADQVRSNASAIAALCGDPNTGGHLNPHHVTVKLPPKSAPLDQYEIGDLSGKHGPLELAPNSQPADDHYAGSYVDDKLPLSGPNGIVGRSVVIHKKDGKRWVCASINAAP